MLLTSFCLVKSLAAEFMTAAEEKRLIDALAGIYCISDKKELLRKIELTRAEPFKNMRTLRDYERECRLIEYSSIVGDPVALSDDDKDILAAFGAALRKKQDIFDSGMIFTADSVKERLDEAVSVGNVRAAFISALLEYHGIALGKNKEKAERNLSRAFLWNDTDAILLHLYVYPDEREATVAKLRTILTGEDGALLVQRIAEAYGITESDNTDENSALMERAFSLGTVRREVFEDKFASFIYSGLIRLQDKKKIVSGYRKETAAYYDDLPSDIDENGSVTPDLSVIDGVKLKRESEMRRIKRNLACVNTRRNKFYKPLLVISKDPYVISMYKQAVIASLACMPAVKLDASLFGHEQLSSSKENIFLRAVSDSGKASTMVIIEKVDELPEPLARELSRYIRGDMRAETRLAYPQLTFDLSACLPVLFASGEVSAELAELCDVVRAEAVVSAEKETVVSDILEYKRRSYGLKSLSVSDEVMTDLVAKSSAQVTDILDEIAKYISSDPDAGKIGRDVLDTLTREMRPKGTKFGF